jgi:hypothetical protein
MFEQFLIQLISFWFVAFVLGFYFCLEEQHREP